MKDNTKKTLGIYWRHYLNHKRSSFLMLLLVVVTSVLSVIQPWYYKKFFDVLAANQMNAAAIQSLLVILVIITILHLMQWIGWRISSLFASYLQAIIMGELANKCFAYLQRHSFSFFNNNFVGSLVKRVRYFVSAFEGISDKIIWNFIPLIINIVIIAAVLWTRSWLLAVGILVWTFLFLLLNWLFTKYKLKYDILRSAKESENTGFLADTTTNHQTLKLFNGYQREVKNYAKLNSELSYLRRLSWDLSSIFEAVQGLLMSTLEIGILYLAMRLWQRGLLTIGDFVLLQSYILNIFMRVWDFGRLMRRIYEELADAEEMTVMFNTPHEIQDAPDAKKLKVSQGKIEFREVDFCYHQTRSVLKNFNLIIPSGQRLALIGPSGAGKTTVVALLLRLYDLSGGKILVDEQIISQVTQESLWQSISLVPQDPMLFHRPLIENIRYGRPGASDREVVAAAKAANCHQFISRLSDGYNTYVGERGVKLSGGERQRVAIARAILRQAPILVLDEATSSLDSESEGLIQAALKKLMVGKTVIVIAHRLSTIRQMDRIVVVDKGQIIEEGNHQELNQKRGGLYAKLWQLQAGGFIQ